MIHVSTDLGVLGSPGAKYLGPAIKFNGQDIPSHALAPLPDEPLASFAQRIQDATYVKGSEHAKALWDMVSAGRTGNLTIVAPESFGPYVQWMQNKVEELMTKFPRTTTVTAGTTETTPVKAPMKNTELKSHYIWVRDAVVRLSAESKSEDPETKFVNEQIVNGLRSSVRFIGNHLIDRLDFHYGAKFDRDTGHAKSCERALKELPVD